VLLLNNLILLPWLAIEIYAGMWRSSSPLPMRPDQWPVRLSVVGVQLACLTAWHSIIRPRTREIRAATS